MSTDRANRSLFLGLLGPPEVIWAGATLSIARRQTRALLYRLAVHLAPVPRTQLGYLLWPDVPDTTARRNLTHLLTLLRRALPRPDLLLTDLSGPMNTMVLEGRYASLAAYEQWRSAFFQSQAFQESETPIAAMVESGSNEFYTIEQE